MEYAKDSPKTVVIVEIVYKMCCPGIGNAVCAAKLDIALVVFGNIAVAVGFVGQIPGVTGSFCQKSREDGVDFVDSTCELGDITLACSPAPI